MWPIFHAGHSVHLFFHLLDHWVVAGNWKQCFDSFDWASLKFTNYQASTSLQISCQKTEEISPSKCSRNEHKQNRHFKKGGTISNFGLKKDLLRAFYATWNYVFWHVLPCFRQRYWSRFFLTPKHSFSVTSLAYRIAWKELNDKPSCS